MPTPPQRPKIVPPRAEGSAALRPGSPSRPAHAAVEPAPAPLNKRDNAEPRPSAPPTSDKAMPASGKVLMTSPRESVPGPSTTQPQLFDERFQEARALPPPPVFDPRHEYRAGEMLGGKYQLLRVIGEGGMGAVWLAKNVTLDVDVAVKLIRRERASPEAATRLLQEAKAAARLGHPSIVRVFDFGESQHKDPYIVMEALNGESLRDLLGRKKRLPPERALRTLMPVAGALVSAHARGIVHRDLKPDNIILMPDSSGSVVPKIVDFGIAKLQEDALSAVRVTLTGQIMGSPGYMSPEQLDGRADIDQRTDVWTFTVVLYEAMTGLRPFEGAHYNAMLSAILLRDPTPTTELGVGDDALWSILATGLSKDPKERWPTIRAMGSALAEWALARGVQTDITGSSLAAHWSNTSTDGPSSDAPPPDHEISISLDDAAATDIKPPDLSPTDRPPRSEEPLGGTPIPDTVPATTGVLSPSALRPPPLGSLSVEIIGEASLVTPGAPAKSMPSVSQTSQPLASRASGAPGRSTGSLVLWVAALAFVVGITATWVIHSLSKQRAATATVPATVPVSASVSVPVSASVPVTASASVPVSASAPTDAPAAQTTPTASSTDAGAPTPSGFVFTPGAPSQLRPSGSPLPAASGGKPPLRPRASAMPLPTSPNF